MAQTITYEQPLNERIRTFLRVEQLMQRFQYHLTRKTTFDTHAALSTLLELLDLSSRGDLKQEIMKELERQLANLAQVEDLPGIDVGLLRAIREHHRELIGKMHAMGGHIGSHLKSSDFLNSIKHRTSIPGGTCDFDLPVYHHWLSQPVDQHHEALGAWIKPYDRVKEAVETILRLIRASAKAQTITARNGFYEQSLERSQPYQMIRILIGRDVGFYPEVSAGKHRFTVRFRKHAGLDVRASQISDNVEFELVCCAL